MRKLYLSICLLSILFIDRVSGAFEERCDYLFHPSTSVYGFHQMYLLSNNQFVFSTTGSQLYSMPECNIAHAGFLTTLPFMHIGMDVSFFGSDLYNENELGVTFFAGNQHLFGTKLKIMRIGIKNYGSKFFGANDLFFVTQATPFYSQSIYRNILAYGYRCEEEIPTSSFSSLLKIYPDTWLSLNIKIIYSELTGTHFEIGNGIQISDKLSIGGGFNFQTRSISTILLLSLPFSDLSYGISLHPELGLTHTVGIVYMKRKRTEKSHGTD